GNAVGLDGQNAGQLLVFGQAFCYRHPLGQPDVLPADALKIAFHFMIHEAARLFGRRPPRTALELHQQFAFGVALGAGRPRLGDRNQGGRGPNQKEAERSCTVAKWNGWQDHIVGMVDGGWWMVVWTACRPSPSERLARD